LQFYENAPIICGTIQANSYGCREMTMRSPLAIAACLALAMVTTAGGASAQDEPYQSSSRLLVLNGDAAAQPSGVRILRGSAAPQRTAAAPQQDDLLGPGRWQVVAGRHFWVFDRDTGNLASCRNRPTANVGERELECVFGTFSRYRRTFGNNFTH
jgi:hypothetical protein